MSSESRSSTKFTKERQVAFANLIGLLRKLGVTQRMHLATVSNPWHLVDMREAMEYINKYYKSAKGSIKKK